MSPKTELALVPPETLGSARTKLVYLYLATGGPTSVSTLQRALDLPKTTLLPILETLEDEGLIVRTDDGISIV